MLLLLLSCAPMYRPRPVHSPMLDRPGDAHLAGSVDLQGGQLAFAWAAGEHLGLRSDVQINGMSDPYGLATVGAGWYRATEGGRHLGLWADLGGGYGEATHTTTWSSSSGETTTHTYHLAGGLAQGAASAELGWEGKAVAGGVELRSVTQLVFHGEGSDETGIGVVSSAELLGLLRAGPGPWRVQAFAGLSLPFIGDGTTGAPPPLILGAGITGDIPGLSSTP